LKAPNWGSVLPKRVDKRWLAQIISTLKVHRDVYYHPAHSASEPNQGIGVTVGLADI
jgi:hypothetical protein